MQSAQKTKKHACPKQRPPMLSKQVVWSTCKYLYHTIFTGYLTFSKHVMVFNTKICMNRENLTSSYVFTCIFLN